MELSEADGLVVADVPVQFTSGGGEAVQGFVRFTLDETGTQLDAPTLYVIDGDVFGAIEPEPGDTVQSLLMKIDAAGSATWVTSGPTLYATCADLQQHGVAILRPPRDGHMAFIKSPDGISIELLQRGAHLPPAEPWLSMANQGSW